MTMNSVTDVKKTLVGFLFVHVVTQLFECQIEIFNYTNKYKTVHV